MSEPTPIPELLPDELLDARFARGMTNHLRASVMYPPAP